VVAREPDRRDHVRDAGAAHDHRVSHRALRGSPVARENQQTADPIGESTYGAKSHFAHFGTYPSFEEC
jgi:hypothetical protein